MAVEWVLDGTLVLSDGSDFVNETIPVGHHTVVVRVRDGFYEVTESVEFTIERSDNEVDEPGYFTYIVIVVIIGVAMTAVLLKRMSFDEEKV